VKARLTPNQNYCQNHNRVVLVWSAPVEGSMSKIPKFKEVLTA
jgi:hypothetical protein